MTNAHKITEPFATIGAVTVTVRREERLVRMTLVGRLDQTSAPGLSARLVEILGDSRDITIDCSGLSFVSSVGIGVFFTIFKHARGRGGTMMLDSMQPFVKSVLDFAGIHKLIAAHAKSLLAVD